AGRQQGPADQGRPAAPGRRPMSTPAASQPASGLRSAHTVMVLAMALYRGYGLTQAGIAVALDAGRYRSLAPVLLLVAALTAEDTVVIALCVRARMIRPRLVAVDTGLAMIALVVGARLVSAADGHTWMFFMYPVSLVGSIAIGFAYRRLTTVLALTTALAATYTAAAMAIHHDPGWNVLPNALSYHANTTVAWAVARYLRATGRRLDFARAEAAVRAALAAEQELRSKHSRALHDRALQTLEMLARGPWIGDHGFRAHVAADAAWLRAFVEHDGPGTGATDLLAGLQDLVQAKALTGLHVELSSAQLRAATHPVLAAPLVPAVVDAVGEALTNVAKHAGVSHATVRARLHPGAVEISIVDHGNGFDAKATPCGIGLSTSITARITGVGGTVVIESAPGQGTLIRLTVPTAHTCASTPSAASAGPGESVDDASRAAHKHDTRGQALVTEPGHRCDGDDRKSES
ncbi:MAG: sensor histidine kinase, partial [Sciscionella sp.]